MSYSRKDLILLQKYKDEKYKQALVDRVVTYAKTEVLKSAMSGETTMRITTSWAGGRAEMTELAKEEESIRKSLGDIFFDAKIEVITNSVSFVIYDHCEIIVKIDWS
jgi:hypothetical protein